MNIYILDLNEIDKNHVSLVGGKAANLGELKKIEGINVPDGFCVSTEVFKIIIEETPLIKDLIERLSLLKIEDLDKIQELSSEIREVFNVKSLPKDIEQEVTQQLEKIGDGNGYAIRSSANAEDLPTVSFAGQQDTYLNVIGKNEIINHISRCWASLFTERAVIYRIKNGFDHRNVHLGVLIQKMILPHASGILFTADPVSGNRKLLSIDASFGLGEALVSGLVNADNYKLHNSIIVGKKISAKKLAIYALKDGGTKEQELDTGWQMRQTLTDEQILQLEHIGRKIEAYFGIPQDIEWCLADDKFYIVQSRPITTLFPIPEAVDQQNHVYVSVGHQQMMTDPLKPLGLSLWQLTAFRPMFKAGGRLFVDVADYLATPTGRKTIIEAMGQHDPLIKDALITIVERDDFIKLNDKEELSPIQSSIGKSFEAIFEQTKNDPVIVADLIKRNETALVQLKRAIQTKSGTDLFDFILEDGQQSKQALFDPKNMSAIMASIDASTWINENIMKWLGEKNAADTLSQSAPNNVTSEMGLELLEVADVIRSYPRVIEYLQQVTDDQFLDGLVQFDGGEETRDAIHAYLNKYGMRCAGEIDITKTRWIEKPITLVPMILNNIKNLQPNAGKRKFEQGQQEALKKEEELLARLAPLADGEQKVLQTKQMISLLRNFAGYREYPKYGIINRFFVYKQALMKEAKQLVRANVIHEKDDIYYLPFEELREVVRTNKVDYQVISKRKDEHALFEKMTPPRVITSEGEIIPGKYNREDLPPGAIAGLAVSFGVVEGRARVILKIENANLEEGDILVTPFTDPSWTPLFVSIKALVTEVGGLMTHGAVIAREYGLPAVVGVENATKIFKDGQRIRVNGTDGYAEILDE